MKTVFNLLKYLTGALFVFSGLVKLNDPSGFSIKLNEYFDVFADDVKPKQDSIQYECWVNGKMLLSGTREVNPFQPIQDYKMYLGIPGGGQFTGCELNHSSLKECGCKISYAVYLEQEGSGFNVTSAGINQIEIDSSAWKNTFYQLKFKFKTSNSDSKQWMEEFKKQGFKGYLTHEGLGPMTGGPDFTIHAKIDQTKLIIPTGFAYDFFKWLKNYSLQLSMFFCALEVILGFALILGWKFKLVWSVTALLIIFFTFLTGYSAYFNKVTDCGCFGDFIKLKPWDSFKKDVILSIVVLLLFLGRRHNVPLISNLRITNWSMAILSFATGLFGILCYFYLPVWDFLPYKVGNDIKKIIYEVPKGERERDSTVVKFVMYNGKDSIRVTTADYANSLKNGYQFVRSDIQIIIEGYKSPIHDFAIYDPIKGDLKDTFLNYPGFQLVWVAPFLESSNVNALKKFNALNLEWKKITNNAPIYALSSASPEFVREFVKKEQLNYSFYSADQKMLMTMARYNPTLYLFIGPVVINKWSGVNIPQIAEIEECIFNLNEN